MPCTIFRPPFKSWKHQTKRRKFNFGVGVKFKFHIIYFANGCCFPSLFFWFAFTAFTFTSIQFSSVTSKSKAKQPFFVLTKGFAKNIFGLDEILLVYLYFFVSQNCYVFTVKHANYMSNGGGTSFRTIGEGVTFHSEKFNFNLYSIFICNFDF